MRAAVLLVVVLATSCLSVPISPLFEPFGDFLQGNILHSKDVFYSSVDYTDLYQVFSTSLEDEQYLDKLFAQFKTRFGRTYQNAVEEEKRKGIFKKNLLEVFAHNTAAATGQSSFTQHINQFADLTTEEVVRGATGYFRTQTYSNVSQSTKAVDGDYYADSTVLDWRTSNIIGPIQDQGSCGACVYFAAAAVVEANWARLGHGITPLSPQQLNDCAHDPRGNSGCQEGGGTFVPTFEYILKHGLDSMADYPYLTKDAACNTQKEAKAVARITSWGAITPHGDEEALRKQTEKGPTAVAIHVQDGFQRYKSGIYDEPCSGGRNHAVIVVGYGHDGPSNKDYWILKNSWGTGFGENGYIRMRRNNKNMCDVAGDAVWVN